MKLILAIIAFAFFVVAIFMALSSNYMASIAYSLIALNIEIDDRKKK